MPFERKQTVFPGPGQERVIARRVLQEERNVHAGAAIGGDPVFVQAGLVDRLVQQAGLGDVARLHGGNSTLAFEPAKYQAGDVDGIGRRRVVHRAVVGHGLVVECAGADRQRVAEQVFTDHHDCQAGGAEVLLRACERQAQARPVHRARRHMGRKIDHQRCVAAQRAQVGQFMELDPVDGLVGANVDVTGPGAQLPGGGSR